MVIFLLDLCVMCVGCGVVDCRRDGLGGIDLHFDELWMGTGGRVVMVDWFVGLIPDSVAIYMS